MRRGRVLLVCAIVCQFAFFAAAQTTPSDNVQANNLVILFTDYGSYSGPFEYWPYWDLSMSRCRTYPRIVIKETPYKDVFGEWQLEEDKTKTRLIIQTDSALCKFGNIEVSPKATKQYRFTYTSNHPTRILKAEKGSTSSYVYNEETGEREDIYYKFDANKRIIQKTEVGSSSSTYSYNENGRLILVSSKINDDWYNITSKDEIRWKGDYVYMIVEHMYYDSTEVDKTITYFEVTERNDAGIWIKGNTYRKNEGYPNGKEMLSQFSREFYKEIPKVELKDVGDLLKSR